MTYVRHQGLEPHVLDSGDVLCALEVLARSILSSLARVIYEVLGYFSECSTFFTEVDDYATTALLGFLYGFFDAKDEVRSASADIGAKDVAAIAFVVDPEREPGTGIGHLCWISKDVDCQAANWG